MQIIFHFLKKEIVAFFPSSDIYGNRKRVYK